MRPLRPSGKIIRKTRLRRPVPEAFPQTPRRLDVLLQRLANFSQPALLALGVFGYFYTVVPVFQNQQLQEQTAKLELEKNAAERKLISLKDEQIKVQEEIDKLQKKWEVERSLNTKLSDEVAVALEREVTAQRKSVEAEGKLNSQLKVLETARWELVILDFTSAYYLPRINSALRGPGAEVNNYAGGFILSAESQWPSPLDHLLSAVDIAKNKGIEQNDIPLTYYIELNEFIKANQEALKCNKPDFSAIHAKYIKDIEALDPVIDKELESYLRKLRDEYMSKEERVQITEEFRANSKRSIRAREIFKIDQAYRDKINSFQNECYQKAEHLIKDFRKTKGAKR